MSYPDHKNALYVIPGNYLLGEPAVKYRGIFINDEAPALSGWVHENYGGFNHQFYEHVFELILRMKGNYLWPAMWGTGLSMTTILKIHAWPMSMGWSSAPHTMNL